MTRSRKITIIVCTCLVCTFTFILGILRGDQGTKPFAELSIENIVKVKTAFLQPDGEQYELTNKEIGSLVYYLKNVKISGERSDPAIDGGFIGMFFLEMKDGSSVMVSASWNYFTYGNGVFDADMYSVDAQMIKPISDMFFDLLEKHGSAEDKGFLMPWDSRKDI